MKMAQRLYFSVGRKIALLVLVAALGVLAMSLLMWRQVERVYEAANFANINTLPSWRELDAAYDAFADMRVLMWRYMAQADAGERQRLDTEIESARRGIGDALRKYETEDMEEPQALAAPDRINLKASRALLAEYDGQMKQVLDLAREKKLEEAREKAFAVADLEQRVTASFQAHRQLNLDFAARAATEASGTRKSALALCAAVGLLTLASVAGIGAFLRGGIVRPVSKLHDMVVAVAGGATGARSQFTQPDEIGELGRAFDKLLDERIAQLEQVQRDNEQLNNSVIALLQTVFQLSNKDLTVRAAVTEDVIGTLSSSINQLSHETGQTLVQVRDIADRVREASVFVNQQASQVDETARGERRALEQMSTQLQRASKQLTQVAQLSEDSNQAAARAAGATEGALRTVSATVRGMNDLREAISETEKRFKRLGERSQEISSAVSLVNTISERTHMLAMNASMQAALAGEAGRGFAVVAEEVQRLSESSRQATATIGQLVQNIQFETNETLYTMNRLISQVVAQSDLAQQAGEQMTQTQATTVQLVQLVQEIAEFSEQQSLLGRELQLSVSKLNKGSELTVSAISEQSRSTGTLVEFASRLAESVAQFKLPQAV